MVNSDTAKYYFAAMNTAGGFRGFFEEIFGDAERLYIIKGGPGTGKSRFMKELGAQAEKRGRKVEYFLCSSDPTSLDGVLFTSEDGRERIGIIDGTSPHAYEPQLVGAKDEILNFGEFWNSTLIRPHKARIASFSEAKKRLYSSVYRYLTAITSLDAIIAEYTVITAKTKKMNAAVDRLLRGLEQEEEYSEKLRLRSGIGCGGEVILDTYGALAKKRYAVLDRFGSSRLFMLRLKKRLVALGAKIQISYSPFAPDTPDAIYIPAIDTSVYVGSGGFSDEKTVNMSRFTDEELLSAYKPKLKELSKQKERLFTALNAELTCIGKLHSELESIYSGAMDFTKKEALTEQMINKIFPK